MYLTLYTHLKVSQLFSKPLFSPVSSALSLPYIYPHTLSVFRLLFISGNFGVACLFFLRFFGSLSNSVDEEFWEGIKQLIVA